MAERSNLEVLKARCKVICNTCYVDDDAAKDVLISENMEPSDTYDATTDSKITKCAIIIVKGWVETSRSETGISASINSETLKKSLLYWCQHAGLDASELLSDELTTIEDGSHYW